MAKVKEVDGRYWYQESADTKAYQIGSDEFNRRNLAQETGPFEAAMVHAGERTSNLLNKLPGVGIQRPPEGYIAALGNEYPKASMAGTMLPYMAGGPLATRAGIPAAMALGGAEGYGFSNPGSEVFDAVTGALGGGLGNMAGRVIQKISPHLPGQNVYDKPALTTSQIQKGKQGRWDRSLANTLGGKGPAQLFGRQNAERMNQLVAEAMDVSNPSQMTKISKGKLESIQAKLRAESDDLVDYNNRLMATPQHLRDRDHFTGVNEKMNDLFGRSKVIELALESVDDMGNIDPGKWLNANQTVNQRMKDVRYSGGERTAIGSQADKATKRAAVLTDPELGAFTHATGRSEEVLADVGRTAFLPHTGIPSLLNFLPSWTPVGAGGAIGTAAGASAPTGLLDTIMD